VLTVCELFVSIQGKSSYAGLPCVFVRLSGCNLRCCYCDTSYAWDAGTPMTRAAVLERVCAAGPGLVEVTGGEPLLQSETVDLVHDLVKAGRQVLLETNGSLPLPDLPGCSVIMDIKCPGSGQVGSFHTGNIERLKPGDQVKFVVTGRTDFEWVVAQVDRYGLLEKKRQLAVLAAPAWNRCEPRALAEWILDSGLSLRLQLQLHKVLWPGRQSGV
jgi:7-carboxy-7-deazaguanine synthase